MAYSMAQPGFKRGGQNVPTSYEAKLAVFGDDSQVEALPLADMHIVSQPFRHNFDFQFRAR